MQSKNIALGVVGLAVVALVAFLISKSPTTTPQNQDQNQTQTPTPQQQLSFLFGEVTKVQAGKIYFTVNGEERIALVSDQTKLVKQISQNGALKVADAALTDFKAGAQIVVYPDPGADQKEFTPDKVQIID